MPQILPYTTIPLTAGGGTVNLLNTDNRFIYFVTGNDTLTSSWTIQLDGGETPTLGTVFTFVYNATMALDGNSITFFGKGINTFADTPCLITCTYGYNAEADDNLWNVIVSVDAVSDGPIDGADIEAGTTPLTALANSTPAYLIVYNSSGIPTAVPITGDVAITNTGVVSFTAGSIVNADINAAAAIAVTKLAAGTTTQILLMNGTTPTWTTVSGNVTISASGVVTIAATSITQTELANASVGTAQIIDLSVTNGKLANGGIQPSKLTTLARTEVLTIFVSFETDGLGTQYLDLAIPGTVSKAVARVSTTIAATDAATIQLQDNSGTNLTGGLITIPLSSTVGTAVSVSPSANNVFTAGQSMRLVLTKTTPGGSANVIISYQRADS